MFLSNYGIESALILMDSVKLICYNFFIKKGTK